MTGAPDSARTWRLRLDACDKTALAKASPLAYKVFRAIVRHAGPDGYAWPAVATLQVATGIRKEDTVYAALRELEGLEVLSRRRLVSLTRGRNAPSLYRIGAEVEEVPSRCRRDFVLAIAQKPVVEPRKRGDPPSEGRSVRGTVRAGDGPSRGGQNSLRRKTLNSTGSVSIGVVGVDVERTPKTEQTDSQTDSPTPDQEKTEPRSPTGARVADPVEPETHGEKTDRFLESTCRAFPGLPSQFVELAFSRVYRQAGEWNSEPERAAYYITGVRKLLDDPASKTVLCEEFRYAKIEFFVRRLAPDYGTDQLHVRIDQLLPRPEPADVDAEDFLRQFRARYPLATNGAGGQR